MPVTKNPLHSLSFAEIHAVIISNELESSIAKKLGTSLETLKIYLSKLLHDGEPLNIARLKKISVDEMQNRYPNYIERWEVNSVNLEEINFSEIHQAVLKSSNNRDAGVNLKTQGASLNRYLSKFSYNGSQLSITVLRNIPVIDMERTYSNYNQPWKVKTVNLDSYPFSVIHQHISVSTNDLEAALKLGVDVNKLTTYLGKMIHDGKPLTIKRLRKISTQEFEALYPNNNQPAKNKSHLLATIKFSYIHKCILKSKTDSEAATKLGVSKTILDKFLGHFQYQNTALSISLLRNIKPSEMNDVFSNYNEPWQVKTIGFQSYNFSYIHNVILQSKDNTEASARLGGSVNSLELYLSKLFYDGANLSIDRLRTIETDEMKRNMSNYDKPWKYATKKLSDYPFSQIHQVILNHEHHHAASILGTDYDNLNRYLNKFKYGNTALSVEFLRETSVIAMQTMYEDYDKPWKVSLQDYPFSVIHHIIKTSKSDNDAAKQLDVSQQSLNLYLSHFSHQNTQLSISVLRTIAIDEMRSFYPNYDKPWKKITVKLSEYNFSYIHQIVLESVNKLEAAIQLKVSVGALERYLGKFSYNNVALSYEHLKTIEIDQMQNAYPNYHEPWVDLHVDLEVLNFSYIHKTILNSSHQHQAAEHLGVSLEKLNLYLAAFSHEQIPLSVKRLQEISPEIMLSTYGADYNKAWKKESTSLEFRPFAEIHNAILQSKTNMELITLLNTTPAKLDRYLGQFMYFDHHLSIDILRKTSVVELSNYYTNYNERWTAPQFRLKNFIFSYIHKTIIDSSNDLDAAKKLDSTTTDVNQYLSHFVHAGNMLSIAKLRIISVEEMERLYPNYRTVWKTNPIELLDYSLAVIHQTILEKNSGNQAAQELNTDSVSLDRALHKVIYFNEPLSTKKLQRTSIDIMFQQCPFYSLSLKQILKDQRFAVDALNTSQSNNENFGRTSSSRFSIDYLLSSGPSLFSPSRDVSKRSRSELSQDIESNDSPNPFKRGKR